MAEIILKLKVKCIKIYNRSCTVSLLNYLTHSDIEYLHSTVTFMSQRACVPHGQHSSKSKSPKPPTVFGFHFPPLVVTGLVLHEPIYC